MKKYINDDDLLNDIDDNYMGLNISVKKVYGYIYRGDTHKYLTVPREPRYFGTRRSAIAYVRDNEYIKRYTTVKKIKLLNLSSNEKNNVRILNFFKQILNKESQYYTKEDVKICLILMQIFFGILIDNLSKLDLFDMEINDIFAYFAKYDIPEGKLLREIFTNKEKYSHILPSRASVAIYDKLFAKKMNMILKQYHIDGFFIVQKPITKDHMCQFLEIGYYDGNLCVPTEICIFNPAEVIGAAKIWHLQDGKFVLYSDKVINRFNKFVKRNYKRLSLKDLYNISLKNK